VKERGLHFPKEWISLPDVSKRDEEDKKGTLMYIPIEKVVN